MAVKPNTFRRGGSSRESGQAAVFLTLALGLFLMGAIGFGTDMTYMWFHRQAAQNAADAACMAAATDMVQDEIGGTTTTGGFTTGTAFNCSANHSYSPCQYAANDGYAASGLTANTPSNDVMVSFPSSVSGVQSCSGVTPPPSVCNGGVPTNAFVQVTVADRVQTFFSGLISGNKTMDVGARATCAALFANAPIPILVLDPKNQSSVSNNGNFTIKIVGGPQRSIQVNATSSSAVSVAGASGTFDLSQGGPFTPPATHGSGSDFGVSGVESATNYNGGTTGHWLDPTSPISDPFASVAYPSTVPPAPAVPSNLVATCSSIPCTVPTGVDGCQDTTCQLYTAGHYTSNIVSFKQTLIFDPGVYYMDANLVADQQSCLRPGTGVGDGSGGTMFYFNGTNTVNVSANAGTYGVCGTTTAVPLSTLQCVAGAQSSAPGTTGITVLPANVIANGGLVGNVLLGPCQSPTAGGTNYGDPLGINDPLGEQRGILFFQDRSGNLAGAGNQPQWGGGGAFGLTGIMYFHYCNSAAGAHLGVSCNQSSGYTDQLSLQGGSCSSTFVIGDIVTDQLHLGGNPCIEMDLNPNALYYVLKATLVQ